MTSAAPAPPARPGTPVVAYVVNRYPAPSHSFIRREILALEALGCRVLRFSLRPGEAVADDDVDAAELARTRALLGGSRAALLFGAAATMLGRPLRSLRALALALRLGWRSDRGLLRSLAWLVEAAALVRAARGAGHLHAHFGTNPASVAMLGHALGGPPFSVTVHGPEEFERAAGIALAEKVARARFVVAISDFGRSQLQRFAPVAHWAKVLVVRCGVDAAFLQPEPLPVPAAPELLWVGRLSPEKGVPVLLDACRLLVAQGVPFHLTMAGDGPLAAWVRGELTAPALAGRVTLAGWRNAAQVRDHLDRARGLVVASFAEGLPVVIMEAMARGRPVVATRIAAIPELVVDGETGWLVPPGRADRLAEALRALLAAPAAEVARLGGNGRARVAADHDVQREAAVLARAFHGR